MEQAASQNTFFRAKNSPQNRKIGKRYAIIILIIIIALIIIVDSTLGTPLHELALERVHSIAAEALNTAVLNVMESRQARGEKEEITNLQTDINGNSLLYIDAEALNHEAAEIAAEAQRIIKETGECGVGVPLGTATGMAALSGTGPMIEVSFEPVGSVRTELYSKFTDAGINQTRYCAYVNLTANIRLVMSGYEDTITVSHSAAICETIIVGEVPSAYTNVDSIDDALNLIPSSGEE